MLVLLHIWGNSPNMKKNQLRPESGGQYHWFFQSDPLITEKLRFAQNFTHKYFLKKLFLLK